MTDRLSQQPYDESAALGVRPISKLLAQYAGPAIAAMTASSFYSMVDSIFIGHVVGAMAISGLALTFPLMNLGAAFGAMVGVGGATHVSVKLGEGDNAGARKVLGNVVFLNFFIGVIYMTIMLAYLHPILSIFGASKETAGYAAEYMTIILYGNIVTHMYFGLNNVLRSSGYPRKAMYLTITTVLLNTVLDPLFIYVFKMGIKGAALATVLAQCVPLVVQIKHYTNKLELLHFSLDIFKPDLKIIGGILGIGLSPLCMNIGAACVVTLLNRSLYCYGGDYAIGAFGITNRLSMLCVMIVMGLNQGMQPIAGYNFGAKQFNRVTEVFKYTVYAATFVTTVFWVVAMFFPATASAIFTSDKKLIAVASEGLTYMSLVYPIIGFQMVTSVFFQSMGMAKISIFLSVTRQILFLIPMLYVLPPLLKLKGIWLVFPASDVLAAVTSGYMVYRHFKKIRAVQLA